MTTVKRKPGRPPSTKPKAKPRATQAYLDDERLRQLAEIVNFEGSNNSKAISQAISFRHAHLKKEWPDKFN